MNDYFYYRKCCNNRAAVLLTRLQKPFDTSADYDAYKNGYDWLLRIDIFDKKGRWSSCTEEYFTDQQSEEYRQEMASLFIKYEGYNPLFA